MPPSKTKVRCPECATVMSIGNRICTVSYKDVTIEVPVEGYFCPKCGEGILEGEALFKMEQAWTKLKKDLG